LNRTSSSSSGGIGDNGVVRIVSLVPSITETLSAWDRTPIACTRFCERVDLEHVGGTKNPDIGRIAALVPDVVVLDAEENRREDHDELVSRGIEVHVVHVRSLNDVNVAMSELAARVDAIWREIEIGPSPPERASAFIPIWRRPWMALGRPTYGADLLAHCGVTSVYAGDEPYPTVKLDDVRVRRPDVVLAPSEPYPFKSRHRAELETVAPTHFVDGKDLFWWGERTRHALVRLADQLNYVTSR
jgi:ABC-type Fe3+-hydroxamate transport system substrate-binding protein